jgi:pre-mRNA 3'-end-processing factor FIP1
MPEEQIAQLPPDVRQMVMAGTNAMMNGGGAPMMQGMLGPGDMDMSGMGMGMPMQNMPMMQGMPMMGAMDPGEQVDFGGMPGGEFGMQVQVGWPV